MRLQDKFQLWDARHMCQNSKHLLVNNQLHISISSLSFWEAGWRVWGAQQQRLRLKTESFRAARRPWLGRAAWLELGRGSAKQRYSSQDCTNVRGSRVEGSQISGGGLGLWVCSKNLPCQDAEGSVDPQLYCYMTAPTHCLTNLVLLYYYTLNIYSPRNPGFAVCAL